MRISDWSSDVCSSDLNREAVAQDAHAAVAVQSRRGEGAARHRTAEDQPQDVRVHEGSEEEVPRSHERAPLPGTGGGPYRQRGRRSTASGGRAVTAGIPRLRHWGLTCRNDGLVVLAWRGCRLAGLAPRNREERKHS